jgi:hypothetical protein
MKKHLSFKLSIAILAMTALGAMADQFTPTQLPSPGQQVIYPEAFGAVVYPTLAGALAGQDDTLALQQAFNYAASVGGEVKESQAGYLKITAPLVVTNACGFEGVGVSPIGVSYTTNADQASYNFASVSPFLTGTVIVNTNATDILDVTNLGSRFDISNVGLMWNAPVAFTIGNGIYCHPPPLGATNYDNGIQQSYWKNVYVWGAGSNNYCFYEMNGLYNRFDHLQGVGGGGFEFDADGYTGGTGYQYYPGNFTMTESDFFIICNGTAKGIYLHNINGFNNAYKFERSQVLTTSPTPLALNPPPLFSYANPDNSVMIDWNSEGQMDSCYFEDLGGYGAPAINNSLANTWINPHIDNDANPLTNMWSFVQGGTESTPSYFGTGITFGKYAASSSGTPQPEVIWQDWSDTQSGGPYLNWFSFNGSNSVLQMVTSPGDTNSGASMGYQTVLAGGQLTGSYTPTITFKYNSGSITASNITAGTLNGNGSGLTNQIPAGFQATNSPVNGYALRYTNGTFYWAP